MSNYSNNPPRSSFARSFFQGGLAETNPNNSNPSTPNSSPRSPARRRDTGESGGDDSISSSAAAAAAVAAAADLGMEANSSNSEGNVALDMRSSWYADALRQGNEESLKVILGAAAAESVSDHSNGAAVESFGDDEVLQQYRIMAQHEARLRVKENIGFDVEDDPGEQKAPTGPIDKRNLYGGIKRPKLVLPEPMGLDPVKTELHPEEPPLLPPRPDKKLVEQKSKRVPELLEGVMVKGGQRESDSGQHVVRCLGCRSNLKVDQKATLVSCPDCRVVSPASSTRR